MGEPIGKPFAHSGTGLPAQKRLLHLLSDRTPYCLPLGPRCVVNPLTIRRRMTQVMVALMSWSGDSVDRREAIINVGRTHFGLVSSIHTH